FSSGELGATLVNTDTMSVNVTIATHHFKPGRNFYWYNLHGGDDNGSFSGKVFVNGKGPDLVAGGPADYASIKANAAPTSGGIRVTVPARGAVFLVIGKTK
ncbi:MAG TPA: alpha-L-arabinofuranosidase, partial [Puia sp.]|nr:alpha-L-arabinofuranosidase [Puia sp.]